MHMQGFIGHHQHMTVWIDTHCHLDAPEFDADRDAVRGAAASQGVGHCVIPAVERSNWDTVRALAHQYGDSYALGIHPLYTGRADDGDVASLTEVLEQHSADPRLVAIGEIGLDYFVPGLDPARQERFYRAQLQLARRFDLPVILHVRRSADKLLKGLRDLPVQGGIAHAFNGSLQQAQAFVGMGFKLGFGGAVTYDRALQLRRLAAELPADALVLKPMRRTSPRIGCMSPLRIALRVICRAAIRPESCLASRSRWPSCAASRWSSWPRPPPAMPCRPCPSWRRWGCDWPGVSSPPLVVEASTRAQNCRQPH